MPDLQSELTKFLTQKQFDDDEPVTTPYEPKPNNTRALWLYVKDHPAITSNEAGVGAGVDTGKAATLMAQMFAKGIMTRAKPRMGGSFIYSITDPNYTPLTPKQALERAVAAKNAAKEAGVAKKYKPRKLPAPVQAKADKVVALAAASEFNPQKLIDTLSVRQARALLDELQKLFSA